jgi:hypothetical protein
VSYPEDIPILRGKDAIEFMNRLKNFKLTEEQKKFYKDAFEYYQKTKPKN